MISPRKAVQALAPYHAPSEGRRTSVRLDFNENTVGFPQAYSGYSSDLMTSYPEYEAFVAELAQMWAVSPDQILLSNGSDEALAVIAQTFIEPDIDSAVVSSPTFVMIPHYLRLAQAKLVEIPATESLTFDLGAIEAALQHNPKLAIFASPDNPTGAILSTETVANWCQRFPNTLFVIDEAYAEYANASVLPLIAQYRNLLVTRTFSKAWGMAALRLGVAIGNPDMIEALKKVRSPYSVNTLALETAKTLLKNKETVLKQAQETMVRKTQVIEALKALDYRVTAGYGNFFLLHVGVEAPTFERWMAERGILVRDRSGIPKMQGMVRVSMGSEAEMQQFIEAVNTWNQTAALIFDLDDTLVDTSKSYDATVCKLVEQYSGKPLDPSELKALRAEGGFNDDWDATVELLRRRGTPVSRDRIETEGKALYFSLAREVEPLWLDLNILPSLSPRYTPLIATGRPRDEYDPLWGDTLNPHFKTVVCQDDTPSAKRKPAPDILVAALQQSGLTHGIYVGNAVDDMQAALAAHLTPVGVTTTHEAAVLLQAGARFILNSVNETRKAIGQ